MANVRINITVSVEMNAKLDEVSKRWGVSKSNLCGMMIGQSVDTIYHTYAKMDEEITKQVVDGKKA